MGIGKRVRLGRFFDGPPRVVTVGNPMDHAVEAVLEVPVRGSVLLDRVDGMRLRITGGQAKLTLGPWDFRAFGIKP